MNAIVIDTSALLAVLLNEPESARCIEALSTDKTLLISAGTLAEAGIVAGRRNLRMALEQLVTKLRPEIVPVTATEAWLAADAYDRWGKGVHRATLNFGDCFAYSLAMAKGCPLLFVGDDFAHTDVLRA